LTGSNSFNSYTQALPLTPFRWWVLFSPKQNKISCVIFLRNFNKLPSGIVEFVTLKGYFRAHIPKIFKACRIHFSLATRTEIFVFDEPHVKNSVSFHQPYVVLHVIGNGYTWRVLAATLNIQSTSNCIKTSSLVILWKPIGESDWRFCGKINIRFVIHLDLVLLKTIII